MAWRSSPKGWPRRRKLVPVGLNLGANKDSPDRARDFAQVLACCGPHVDFATVNVSSPNTERLRDLQGRAALEGLLKGVMEANAALALPVPIFLKIAPDLEDDGLAEIAEVARATGIACIIATNTTLSREGLGSRHRDETGGLSGQPLFERSTRVLARLCRLTKGEIPLLGVGGVATAEQAWEKTARRRQRRCSSTRGWSMAASRWASGSPKGSTGNWRRRG